MFNKVIIVGAGPAGISCAIQLKRMGIEAWVIEKNSVCEMLHNANLIENYPGFPGGIPGPLLARKINDQAKANNLIILHDEILQVRYAGNQFLLEGNDRFECDILVLASGTRPMIPDTIPQPLLNSGFIHFDIRELRNASGKNIGIIGAGDAAFDYALTLAASENFVRIFNRSDKIKALQALQPKVFMNSRIEYCERHSALNIKIIDNESVEVIFKTIEGTGKYSLDYLIFATGRIPEDQFFRETLKDIIPRLVHQNRLYFAGDLVNEHYRQVAVAAGQGVRLAMEIFQNENR